MTPSEVLWAIGAVMMDPAHIEHGWAMRDPSDPSVWLAVDTDALDDLIDMIRCAEVSGGLELDEIVARWAAELVELQEWIA